MKYKLIKPIQHGYTALQQVLYNRGIELKDMKGYLNTTDSCISHFSLFGPDLLQDAASVLIRTISNNDKAVVIIDSDCDGFTSAATIINYLYDLFPAWVSEKLSWFMHDGKQHGLSDFNLEDDIKLIIIPDAGSNDYEYHKKYNEQNIEIIVLDHHEAEKLSDHAIVINNQLSEYPNKHLSGVGVVWQFCKYLDSLMNINNADKYLDLVALGLDADMMSLKEIETKHLIEKGFKQLQNPFFEAMVEKNDYSMKSKVNPISVAFYVAPYVNAIVRSGTIEEKQIVFRSMLNFEAYKKVPSTKRGHKLGEEETILAQALRTCTNVKNRQTRAQDAGLEFLEKMIEEQNLLDHKVLLFLLEPGQIDRNIAGLIANKFMAKYQRPCCILTKVTEKIEPLMVQIADGVRGLKWNTEHQTYTLVTYQGSARGYDKSGITNFKDICIETDCIRYAEGHQGAFGLGLDEDMIDEFLAATDEALKDMSSEPVYWVDFVYDGDNVDADGIVEIASHDELWGKDMDEPIVAIHNVRLTKDMVSLMSPDKKPTLKITLPNKVSLIKFNSSQEEYESFISEEGWIKADFIGKCNANEWNGHLYPQVFIEDFQIVDSCQYFF